MASGTFSARFNEANSVETLIRDLSPAAAAASPLQERGRSAPRYEHHDALNNTGSAPLVAGAGLRQGRSNAKQRTHHVMPTAGKHLAVKTTPTLNPTRECSGAQHDSVVHCKDVSLRST